MKPTKSGVTIKSKELNIKRTTRQNIPARSSTPDEFKMTGAIRASSPHQDGPIEVPKRTSLRSSIRNQNISSDSQQHAKTTRSSPRPATKSPIAAPIESRLDRAHTPDAGLSTDSDLYGLSPSGEISREKIVASRRASVMRPQSAIKAISTPAVETSILALNKFKRRTRQPSMIRLMQESSMLGGADDFLDDFDPEDESTPLHTIRKENAYLLPSSGSRKRKLNEHDQPVTSDSFLSSPPASSPIVATNNLPREFVASIERDDEQYSDTMAPPMSSSSDASPLPNRTTKPLPAKSKPVGDNTKRRKKAAGLATDVLQSYLPRARRGRRKTVKETYDIPSSSSLPVDDDPIDSESELSEPDIPSSPPKRRATASKKTTAQKTKAPSTRQAPKNLLAERDPVQANSKVPRQSLAITGSAKPKRTYSARQTQEDKENETSYLLVADEADSSTIIENLSKTVEMQKMQQKFADVDDWEMEFESVDMGGTSSPWR